MSGRGLAVPIKDLGGIGLPPKQLDQFKEISPEGKDRMAKVVDQVFGQPWNFSIRTSSELQGPDFQKDLGLRSREIVDELRTFASPEERDLYHCWRLYNRATLTRENELIEGSENLPAEVSLSRSLLVNLPYQFGVIIRERKNFLPSKHHLKVPNSIAFMKQIATRAIVEAMWGEGNLYYKLFDMMQKIGVLTYEQHYFSHIDPLTKKVDGNYYQLAFKLLYKGRDKKTMIGFYDLLHSAEGKALPSRSKGLSSFDSDDYFGFNSFPVFRPVEGEESSA